MIIIAILAIAFVAGAMAGIAALLRLGIARDDSRRSLRSYPETRAAAATRRVLGLYASMPPSATALRSPAGAAEALQSRRTQTLPGRQPPRQLAAPCPRTHRDGLR